MSSLRWLYDFVTKSLPMKSAIRFFTPDLMETHCQIRKRHIKCRLLAPFPRFLKAFWRSASINMAIEL